MAPGGFWRLLVVSGKPWCSLASRCITAFSVSPCLRAFVFKFPHLRRIPVTRDQGLALSSVNHSNSHTSAKTLLPSELTITGWLGGKDLNLSFWGDIFLPTTLSNHGISPKQILQVHIQ